MAIAKSTYDVIVDFEGKRRRAYKDTKGLWTTGIGHLILPNEEYLIAAELTDQQVENLFQKDAAWCEDCINNNVKVPITQNQKDALFSLCFNIGKEHFEESTLLRVLNNGNYKEAADQFLRWNKPEELTERRKKERALFLRGI